MQHARIVRVGGFACDCLTSLTDSRWLHQLPISTATLYTLQNRHGNSLRTLRLHSIVPDKPISTSATQLESLLANLLSFECRSMCGQQTFVGTAIAKSAKSLRTLRLGQEDSLSFAFGGEGAYFGRDGFYGHESNVSDVYRAAQKSLAGASPSAASEDNAVYLNLEVLELVSLESAPLIRQPHSLYWEGLKALTIEDCALTIEDCADPVILLEHLTRLFGTSQQAERGPNLKEFRLRRQDSPLALYEPLNNFLKSFSGLRLLSILLDGCERAPYELNGDVLKAHGRTLKILVLESRDECRCDAAVHGSHMGWNEIYSPDGEPSSQLSRIVRYCPNLSELSLCFPWDHTVDGYDGFLEGPAESLALHMPHLKTLEIRNSVVLRDAVGDRRSGMSQAAQREERRCLREIEVHHTKFANAIAGTFLSCRAQSEMSLPKLGLIVIGSLRYKDRWHLPTNTGDREDGALHPPDLVVDLLNRPQAFQVVFPPSVNAASQVAVAKPFMSDSIEMLQSLVQEHECLSPYWID